MARELPPPPPAWRVMRLLWAASRRRAAGRMRRQGELMGRRRASVITSAGWLQFFAVLVACFVHAALGWSVWSIGRGGEATEARDGRIEIASEHWRLLEEVATREENVDARKRALAALPRPTFRDRRAVLRAEQARDAALTRFVERVVPMGKKRLVTTERRAAVERQFRERGRAGFVRYDSSVASLLARSRDGPRAIVPMLGLILVCWLAMLVCQGEGLELDVQRRRHPMWEWLFSHPVRPAHAFYAELLAPLMVNPVYWFFRKVSSQPVRRRSYEMKGASGCAGREQLRGDWSSPPAPNHKPL